MLKKLEITDDELCSLYKETKSLRKVAKQANVSTTTVSRKLKELGMCVQNSFLKPIKVSDEKLISLYLSGKTLLEIAKEVSGSKGGMEVKKRLNSLGVNTSRSSRKKIYSERLSLAFKKYKLNHTVFDKIDSEEKAYWLGFLYADGYNQEDRNCISLLLLEEDLEILEKFKSFLDTNVPILKLQRKTKKNKLLKIYYRISINSVHLSKALAKLGCVQNKTKKLVFPTYISENLILHFIRGYFDGNGCISITKRNDRKSVNSFVYLFTIVGKEDFLYSIQQVLIKNTLIKNVELKSRKDTFVKTLHYNGYNVVLKILNYLYNDSNIYMKRKHNKYLKMVTRLSNLQK